MNIDLVQVERVAIAAGKVGAPFIEQALMALAASTGPIAPMVLNMIFPMINKALGIDAESSLDQTADTIEANPDVAKAALDQLSEDHTFQLTLEKQNQDYQVASQGQQVSLNTVEESNPSLFVAGWRPLIGWSLGGILMLSASLPFFVWGLNCIGVNLPIPPQIDQNSYYVLCSILGITIVARSFDKATGTGMKAIGGKSIKTTKVVS